MSALVAKINERGPRRAELVADRAAKIDAAVELLELLGRADLARAVEQAEQPSPHVRECLRDYDFVVTELRLKVENGTPATADYVLARDLLDSIGGVS